MGFNTVFLMLNDCIGDWPEDMRQAMNRLMRGSKDLGCKGGKAISMTPSDETQIVEIGGNTGRELTPYDRIDDATLQKMATILRGHGYAVQAPGQDEAQPPLKNGYASEQKQQRRNAAPSAKSA